MDDSPNSIIQRRISKVTKILKQKSNWIIYFLLALVTYISVKIRTLNTSGLRDVTTGGWTLGPDLDPFLFLRYAKDIVVNGHLFVIDQMRYVPVGFKTGLEYPLISYSIAWFHKLATLFGSVSIEQSAVYFPVFMFALTVISFFLLTRESFFGIVNYKKASFIAIIACFFLSVIPVLIPRTIAGIPEKESAAFFYMFMSFYFFLVGWRQKTKTKQYLYSAIGGLFGGLMALTWGGYGYILLIMSLTMLTLFLFGQIEKKKFISYALFIIVMFSLMFIFLPGRTTIKGTLVSVEGFATWVTFAVLFSDLVLHKYFSKYIPKKLGHYPRIASLIYGGVLFTLIGILFLGPSFIVRQITTAYSLLGKSASSRLIQTVAENRHPFFVEWASNFGPIVFSIPLLLGLTFIGSIILMYHILSRTSIHPRERTILVGAWTLLICAIALTRYSPQSVFNGSGFLSSVSYLLGIILIFVAFNLVKNKVVKREEENPYKNISMNLILLQMFFVIGLLSARTFIRLVLMLAPVVSIFVAYVAVMAGWHLYKLGVRKEKFAFKAFLSCLIILSILFAGYTQYNYASGLARGYIPSGYTQQWQKAMEWVRESTPTNAVFAHWWDYGYWVQSMGERATVLDGGNILGYWNYFMGRHALTETNMTKTFEFFYAHNVTHFLIDSTDIGKYTAFSTIGSNSSYDRRSWIPTLLRDNAQTIERKNATIFVYPGGNPLDQDIIYNQNGTELFLPEGKTYLAAILLTVNETDSISDVSGVYFLQDKTYQIPLRYYWDKQTGIVDRGKGVDAGIFIYPRVTVNAQGGGEIEPRGALLYLSTRTVRSNLARFYLYGELNVNFPLAHLEPDALVKTLESQSSGFGDFVYFNEFRGPIKIWALKYPKNTRFNEEYLETDYPEDLLFA